MGKIITVAYYQCEKCGSYQNMTREEYKVSKTCRRCEEDSVIRSTRDIEMHDFNIGNVVSYQGCFCVVNEVTETQMTIIPFKTTGNWGNKIFVSTHYPANIDERIDSVKFVSRDIKEFFTKKLLEIFSKFFEI